MQAWIRWTLIIFLLATSPALADDRSSTLVLGSVITNYKKNAAALQPMVDYVASKLGDVGIVKGEIFLTDTREELITALQEGQVDWVTKTPFSVLLIMEQTDTEFLARRWKQGTKDYTTLFFVHKESDLQSVEQLKGRTVAFEHRDSTSNFFVPLAVLRAAGLKTIELTSPREKPPLDQTAYIFAHDETNIFYWVQRKLVDAGVASTSDWDAAKPLQGHFRIIHQTRPLPRAVELVRKDLPSRVKARLKEVLFQADQDPLAQNALNAYHQTQKFDAMDEEALAGMAYACSILQQIRDVVE